MRGNPVKTGMAARKIPKEKVELLKLHPFTNDVQRGGRGCSGRARVSGERPVKTSYHSPELSGVSWTQNTKPHDVVLDSIPQRLGVSVLGFPDYLGS